MPRSWKAEVQTTGGRGVWNSNSLRFATEGEADSYAADLMYRWTQVHDIRATECDDPVNYRWDDNEGAVRLEPPGDKPDEVKGIPDA